MILILVKIRNKSITHGTPLYFIHEHKGPTHFRLNNVLRNGKVASFRVK